jgi:hypothetical protein
MSIERPSAAMSQLGNERLMLREYAAKGLEPAHSGGMLHSVSLIERVKASRALLVAAGRDPERQVL